MTHAPINTCAWCKSHNDHFSWTDEREPLCSQECLDKYRFGKAQGLITGSASALSATQRREISAKLHTLTRFRGTMSAIKRQELRGNYKLARNISGLVIFVCTIVALGYFYAYTGLPEHAEYSTVAFLLFGASLLAAFAIVVYLYSRIEWYLRFKQLKKDSGL